MPVNDVTTSLLITLRGNSGSGKSTVAAKLRAAYGRGIAIIPQDVVRREILRERDVPDAVNVDLLGIMARHILEQGVHVVLEGILYASHYGPMLDSLRRAHGGPTFGYYFDIPYETTVILLDRSPRHELWQWSFRSTEASSDNLSGATAVIQPVCMMPQNRSQVGARRRSIDLCRIPHPSRYLMQPSLARGWPAGPSANQPVHCAGGQSGLGSDPGHQPEERKRPPAQVRNPSNLEADVLRTDRESGPRARFGRGRMAECPIVEGHRHPPRCR